MVKPGWYSDERYSNAKECIEAQFKKYGIISCLYDFMEDGSCCTQLLDAQNVNEATAEEMIDIAVEHFNKYGEVIFEGFGTETDKYDGYVATIGCYDENAFKSKY